MKHKEFRAGMRAALPVCVGYFSVGFGFGTMAVTQNLSIWQATLISASNLTSAGQFAGLTVIAAGAAMVEMILMQLVINSRYALMSLALSQRLGPDVSVGKRLLVAFFNTDEVFALAMSWPEKLTPSFFVGAGVTAGSGWVLGTALGAAAGSLLPICVQIALGVMLYGMFTAIIVPQVREEKEMLVCVIVAVLTSCAMAWVPWFNRLSDGTVIVICTVAAAAVSAVLFPLSEEAEQ